MSKSSDKRERQIRVHFDNFMSKWDEFYGEHEWKEGKLAPLYSKVMYCILYCTIVLCCAVLYCIVLYTMGL